MTENLDRRDFLKASAAFAGIAATGAFSCVEIASAAPIQVPTVDKLSIKVLVDSSFDQFFRPPAGRRRVDHPAAAKRRLPKACS